MNNNICLHLLYEALCMLSLNVLRGRLSPKAAEIRRQPSWLVVAC